jgi:hypothetical protein
MMFAILLEPSEWAMAGQQKGEFEAQVGVSAASKIALTDESTGGHAHSDHRLPGPAQGRLSPAARRYGPSFALGSRSACVALPAVLRAAVR